MPLEMTEDDYKLTPCGYLGGRTAVSQYGKHKGEFSTTEDALEFVKEDMERSKFWPGIWWISDHGNGWPINLDGEEIHVEDDDEEEGPDYGGDDWQEVDEYD